MTQSPIDRSTSEAHADSKDILSPTAIRVLWVVFLLLFGWYLSGAFPVGVSQFDALQEATGIEHLARYGWDAPLLTHNTVGCPGLTWTLLFLRRTTGADPIQLIGILSAVSGVIYILAGAGLIGRIAGIPYPVAGLVLLLSPVAITAGMYGNDMITSSAFAILALYLLSGSTKLTNLLAGAVCLALAGWYRADAVLITGVIPLLLYRGDMGKMIRQVIGVGLLAAGLAIALVYLSGSNLKSILLHADAVSSISGSIAQMVGFYFSFFPLIMVFLLVVGFVAIFRRHEWRQLGIFLIGVVPLWLVHLSYPFPKYFTHVVPFFAAICAAGVIAILRASARRRGWGLVAIALLFVGQYVIGLRVTLRDKPWRTPPETGLIKLYARDFDRGRIDHAAIVIGLGTPNPFGHAGTPISGVLFTPLEFRKNSRDKLDAFNAAADYVRNSDQAHLTYFSCTHGGVQCAVYALVKNGYRCEKMYRIDWPFSWKYEWTKGDRTALQYRIEDSTFNLDFLRSFGDLEGVYITFSGREAATILPQTTTHKLIYESAPTVSCVIYEVTLPPLKP